MNVEVRRIHPTDAKKIRRHLHSESFTGRHRADQYGCGWLARGLDRQR